MRHSEPVTDVTGVGIRFSKRITDCHVVEAQDTMFHFLQAENSACILASPPPTKAIRLCGGPEKDWFRNDAETTENASFRASVARREIYAL